MGHFQQGLDGHLLSLFGSRVASLALILGLLFTLVVSVGSVQTFAASSGCDRTYDGDLVLAGNQVLQITGETVCVHGNVVVKDNAKLTLTNATLRIFGTNIRIEVDNSACLTLDHVNLETPKISMADEPVSLYASDEVKVKIESVHASIGKPLPFGLVGGHSQVIIRDSSFTGIRVSAQATVFVTHSKLDRVELSFADPQPVEVTGLVPRHIDHLEFAPSKAETFDLTLDDVQVGNWLVDVGSKGNVVIKDSILSGLVLSPDSISGTLSGLRPETFASWSLHGDNDVNCAMRLKLVNTRVESWFLHFTNRTELTIYDSDLVHIAVYNGYVDLSLRDVRVSWRLTVQDALGKIDFFGSSIREGIEFDNATLTLTGNVSISPDCYVREWQNSTIIRDFPVVIQEDFDTPASQMPVEIGLPDDRTLNQMTDDNGRTSFQCTFTDSTYQDACQVRVTTAGKAITHSVGFLESTPVTIGSLRADTSADALFVATEGALSSLDPYNIQLHGNGSVFPNVYEPLFLRNIMSPSPAVPLLATEVPSLANDLVVLKGNGSCDITIPIRTGVAFHDGTTLSPTDVEYSLEFSLLLDMKDALSPTLTQALFGVDSCDDLVKEVGLEEACGRVQAAVEVEGSEVVIHLKKAFSPWLDSLSKIPILSKAWTISHGGWNGTPHDWARYRDLPEEKTLFHLAANGTGPFVVEKFTPGTQLLLKRNKDYWRTPAQLKWVVINEIKDWGQLPQEFENGQLDMIDYRGELSGFAEQISLLRAVPNVDAIDCTPNPAMSFILFNRLVTEPADEQFLPRGELDESSIPADFFNDSDVRKGFIYAFDFPAFAQSALLGNAQRRNGPVWGDCPEQEVNYSYDPAKAAECFQKAFGGRLWKIGFTVTITYNQGNQLRQQAAETIKRSVESLNPTFHIVISPILFKAFAQKLLLGDSLPLFIIGLNPSDTKNLRHAYIFMHTSGIFGEKEIPMYDELIEEAYRTMDVEQRNSLLCQLARAGDENSMGIFWQQSSLHVQQQWIQGWTYAAYLNNGNTICFYPIWKKMKER